MKKNMLLLVMTTTMFILPACTSENKLSSFKNDEILVENKSKAIHDLHSLAIDGVPVAVGKLAQEYYDGILIKRNDEKALYWAEKGNELKDPLATLILARMHYYGEGVVSSPKTAIDLLEKIKEQRLDARYVLGKIYENESKNDPKYLSMGLSEIKNAAELGLAQAQVDMAEILRSGAMSDKQLSQEVKQETLKKSAEYLAMAVAQDNPVAIRNLGMYYKDGIGVPKDQEKAKYYLDRSASQ